MADFSKLNINDNTYDVKDSAARASITALQSEMPDKEDVSNKVTSMSAASTDTEYPSAKCVYDALENSQLFFKCVFRQTLYQDIANAINAGKIPYLIHDSILMFLCTYNIPASGTNRYVDFGFGFNADDGNLLGRIRVTYQETWSFLRFIKTQTIDSASTNSQLPTAKSVYDFVSGNFQKTLYKHHITLNFVAGLLVASITFDVINDHAEEYTIADKDNMGIILRNHVVAVNGNFDDLSANFCYATSANLDDTQATIYGFISSSKLASSHYFAYTSINTITDTVGW